MLNRKGMSRHALCISDATFPFMVAVNAKSERHTVYCYQWMLNDKCLYIITLNIMDFTLHMLTVCSIEESVSQNIDSIIMKTCRCFFK